VLSSPEPEKYGATWEKAADGGPWVVVFNNFLNNDEVVDLIRGGEIEGFERSTDQGEANEVGEVEKIVSTTRTSSNAWCMHQCERLPGVRSATKKIEEVTG
jgi:prolyl 4-hydroxylase